MSANIIPVEGATIGYCTTSNGTYTTLSTEVTSITPPGVEVSKVDTWGLASSVKTSRPGKIPDLPEVDLTFYADPNWAAHAALMTAAQAGTSYFWKITYVNDGKTSHATDVFPGYILKLEPGELSEENNLEWTLTIQPTALSTFTAGT